MNHENSTNSIVTIAGEFKEVAELKEYCNKQYEFIESLTKQVELLRKENEHLKSMLVTSLPIINTNTIKISDEEMICLEQIAKLKEISTHRELSLDETKRLDLLHKNLKLSREASSEAPSIQKNTDIPTKDLLKLVSKKEG